METMNRNLLEMALIGYQTEKARIESEKKRIDAAIAHIHARLRNQRPVHSYWTGERTARVLAPEGRKETIEELKRIWQVLRTATAIVHRLLDRYLAAYGQNIQRFMDQAGAMWVSDIEWPSDQALIQ